MKNVAKVSSSLITKWIVSINMNEFVFWFAVLMAKDYDKLVTIIHMIILIIINNIAPRAKSTSFTGTYCAGWAIGEL